MKYMCENCEEKEVKDIETADHECQCGQHVEKKCECDHCE